jgi:hypothetical protein
MIKRLLNLSNRTVLLLLGALVIVPVVVSLLAHLARPAPDLSEWLEGFLLNFSTEMLGAIATFVLLYLIVAQRDRLREQQREERELKKRLIRQLRSQVNEEAIRASEELRAQGWLTDGSLQGADLSRANLENAYLEGVNLTDASLYKANLKGAHIQRSNLKGARGTKGEQFAQVGNLRGTTMPDGNRYDGRYNLARDIAWAGHTDGVDTSDPAAMADWYGVSLEDYQRGQEWARENLPKLRGEPAQRSAKAANAPKR